MPESNGPPSAVETGSPPQARRRRLPLWAVAAVVLAPIAIGWPYLGREGSMTPDAIDYVNIARNLARGRGFVHTIKWHYFDEQPVIAPAFGARMPLYSIFIAPIAAAGGGPKAMAAANLALVGLAGLGAALLAFRMAGTQAALASGLVVGVSPVMLFWASYPLTEPLFVVLCFSSILLFAKTPESPDANRRQAIAAAAGLLSFAAYLTRSTGAALALTGLFWLARRRAWRETAAAALAFLILFLAWSAALKIFRGSYGYSMQNYHMVCRNFADEMGQSYGKAYPGALEFVRGNAGTIAQDVWRNLVEYARVFAGAGMLSFLTLLLPFAVLKRGRSAEAELLALFALLNYAMSAGVWSTHEGDRFMLPSFAALAPVAAAGAQRVLSGRRGWRFLPAGVAAAVLALYMPATAQSWRRAKETRVAPMRLTGTEVRILEQAIPEQAIVGTDMPFEANFYCDRPTAWAQWENPRFDFPIWARQYGISCLALSPQGAAALRSSPAGKNVRSLGSIAMAPLMEWFILAESEPAPEGKR